MQDENYYVVSGWMINRLKLRGNELTAFAVIYGFSQTDGAVFNGSLDYLCKSIGCARRAALNVLQRLMDKGLIFKQKYDKNGLKNTAYFCNLKAIDDLTSAENAPVQKMRPDNIYIYKNTKHTGTKQTSTTSINNTNNNISGTCISGTNIQGGISANISGTKRDKKEKAPVQRVLIRPKVAKNGPQRDFNGVGGISTLLGQIEGGKAVLDKFLLFMQGAKEGGLKIGRVWVRAQIDLINWVEDPEDKILVLEKTTENGWKSLRFVIEQMFKCKIPSQAREIITTTKIGR